MNANATDITPTLPKRARPNWRAVTDAMADAERYQSLWQAAVEALNRKDELMAEMQARAWRWQAGTAVVGILVGLVIGLAL